MSLTYKRTFLVALIASLMCILVASGAMAFTPVKGAGPGFGVICEPVTDAAFDPIVYPGTQPPVGHEHSFMGNTAINPDSTPQSLRDAGESTTSCRLSADEASYWLPTADVPIRHIIAYYMPVGNDDNYNVHSKDLEIIAGSVPMDGNSTPDPNVKFGCQSSPATSLSPVDCTPEGGPRVKVEIEFPDCQAVDASGAPVDDSADHRSHMAYSNPKTGRCPDTHPYKVTKLNLHVIYEAYDARDISWSVPPYDLHADFMNGWDQAALAQAIEDCIVGERNGCQRISD